MKKTNFFGHNLEKINQNEILTLISNLKKNFPHINFECQQNESIDDSLKAQKSPTLTSIKNKSKVRYPIYDNGSFKEDIDNFLNTSVNNSIKKIFKKIEIEINKVFKSYLTIENILYDKIVQLLNFYDNKEEFSKLQIISRIKEISEILEETYSFINDYLFYNFNILKTILENLDMELVNLYHVKSLSLIFLLKYFELPNNELSYMLVFKIFDEETLILNLILNEFKKQIESDNSIETNIRNIEKEDNLVGRVSNIFNDENEEDKKETINAMLDLSDTYINKSNDISKKINDIYSYRAQYINYFIYLLGNYNIDSKNRLLSGSLFTDEVSSINSSELSELVSINTLMDEEVIIKNFLNKNILNEFLSFFKENLTTQYKINKFLIIINCIQYYSILPLIIFNHYKEKTNTEKDIETQLDYFKNIYLYLISYHIGKLANKIICKSCLSKKLSLKTLLIINNIILFISLCLLVFKYIEDIIVEKYLLIINRFLYGLSNSKLIISKFLITFEPKLLVINSIKFFFRLKYISLFLVITYISIINYFLEKREFDISYINNDLLKNNTHEFFFLFPIFIIMLINIFLFKNIKLKDIIKKRESFENIIIKSDKNILNKKSNVFESTSSDVSKVSDDRHSVISFGKSKLITYGNRRKAKRLDKQFKSFIKNEKYEGTNQIFEELDEIIFKQNNCCSYINKITFGLLFILMCLCINNEILMVLINSTNDYFIDMSFAFSFLVGYLFLFFKNYFLKENKNNIKYLNIIILIMILLEILFYIIMGFFEVIIADDNYKYIIIVISIIIEIINIMLESLIIYLMSLTIPIEKKICSINIGKFIDIFITLFKVFSFSIIYFMNIYIFNGNYGMFKFNNIIFIHLSAFYCLLQSIIFYFFNYRINYTSLSRIMNKISYEK